MAIDKIFLHKPNSIILLQSLSETGFFWELSSAGSEHLPYKQRVGGSNPSAPTLIVKLLHNVTAFLFFGVDTLLTHSEN